MFYHFTNKLRVSQLDEVIQCSLGTRLFINDKDYPDIYRWAQETYQKLRQHEMQAVVGFDTHRVIGSVIYQWNYAYRQAHKRVADVTIRRISVEANHRGRYVASFLLRNAEIEAHQKFAAQSIAADAKVHNQAIQAFLLKQGYSITERTDLYSLDAGEDFIYTKPI